MMKLIDITGRRYGRLEVLGRAGTYYVTTRYPGGAEKTWSNPTWRCRCDCGAEVTVLSRNLKSGRTRSCGCLRREKAGRRKVSV